MALAIDLGTPGNNPSLACTYNGVAMTILKQWQSGGSAQTVGYLTVFHMANPPSGAHTVAFSGTGTADKAVGGSLSFLGGGTLGTAVTADSAGASVATGSVAVTGTATTSMVAGFVTDGSDTLAFTSGTQRWAQTSAGTGAAGCSGAATAAGTGGTVTLSFTQASDFYGAIAVEIKAAVTGVNVTPTTAAVTVTAHPPGPVFAGGATVPTAAVTVTAYPPTPTLPPFLLGLPAINDWPVNYTPTYSDLNLYVRDAFNFLKGPPVCRVQQSSTQSLGSVDLILYQTVIEDNYSGWQSGSSNGYVAQVPGWYALTARMNAVVTAGTGISFGPSYVLNGVQYGPIWLDLAEAGSANWTWVFYEEAYLDTGDEVFVYTGGAAAGGGSPATALTAPSTFEIVWLSE